MQFNSIFFLLFLIGFLAFYYITPHRFRFYLLIGASIVTYGISSPIFLLVSILLIFITYYTGLKFEKPQYKRKNTLFIISAIGVLIIFFVFKYSNVFSLFTEVNNIKVFRFSLHISKLIPPIGISFQIFMALSYLFEIYLGNIHAEKDPKLISLYLMFFPIIAAGPIERPYNLIPQFNAPKKFDVSLISSGFRLLLLGYFKKVVIADRLGIFVNAVYDNPDSYVGFPLIWATFFFAFQIYCDFSAYTDMARGIGKMMGVNLSENFKQPYFSSSVAEFWRRWHISLSSWLRDYLFNPLILTLRKFEKLSLAAALIITFFFCGLWHGATTNFMIWGTLHGVLMIIERPFTSKKKKKNQQPHFMYLRIPITFIILCVTWIFFRSRNLQETYYIITHLHHLNLNNLIGVPIFTTFSFFLNLILIGVVLIIDAFQYNKFVINGKWKMVTNYLFIGTCILAIITLGLFEKTAFIYTQF